MSDFPYMPLFVGDYLADTDHLSTEEHGAYVLLLMAMWRRGGTVPDDDRDLARMTRLTRGKWLKVKKRLGPLLSFHNGEISQKRLQKEFKNAQKFSEKQRANALKRWAVDDIENNDLDDATALPTDMPNACLYNHNHINKDSIGQKSTVRPLLSLEPDGFSEFWNIYPRKVAKRGAEKAYRKALARASPDTILAGAKRYAAAKRGSDPQFIAHAAKWLNQDQWADEDASAEQEDDDWRKLRLL